MLRHAEPQLQSVHLTRCHCRLVFRLSGGMRGWIETAFRAFDVKAWLGKSRSAFPPPADFCAMVGLSPS